MSETFRTAWLSDIVDILDDPKTKSIICHGKQFDLVKHGHWVNHLSENGATDSFFCSLCDYEKGRLEYGFNYCPYCGAKMDEVEEWTGTKNV